MRLRPCADECRSGPARAATRHAGLDSRAGYRHGRPQRGAGRAEAPVTSLKKRLKTLVGDSRLVITWALAAMLLTWGAALLVLQYGYDSAAPDRKSTRLNSSH